MTKQNNLLLGTAAIALVTSVFAFESTAGWKLDADGHIELKDGNPVYVNSNGEEATVGGDTISNLNKEAKGHREAKEAAENALKAFKGLDAEKARKAIEDMSKIDAKTLIDAGEVDRVKEEIKNSFTEQLNERDKTNEQLQNQLNDMRIDKVFESSEFIRENVDLPQDIFQAYFRKNFKIEDGELNAYDNSGNVLRSKKKVGEIASPEEALEMLVEGHASKERILKSDGQTGSGGSGSGSLRGRTASISTAELQEKSPAEQADIAAKAGKGEITIT